MDWVKFVTFGLKKAAPKGPSAVDLLIDINRNPGEYLPEIRNPGFSTYRLELDENRRAGLCQLIDNLVLNPSFFGSDEYPGQVSSISYHIPSFSEGVIELTIKDENLNGIAQGLEKKREAFETIAKQFFR